MSKTVEQLMQQVDRLILLVEENQIANTKLLTALESIVNFLVEIKK